MTRPPAELRERAAARWATGRYSRAAAAEEAAAQLAREASSRARADRERPAAAPVDDAKEPE